MKLVWRSILMFSFWRRSFEFQQFCSFHHILLKTLSRNTPVEVFKKTDSYSKYVNTIIQNSIWPSDLKIILHQIEISHIGTVYLNRWPLSNKSFKGEVTHFCIPSESGVNENRFDAKEQSIKHLRSKKVTHFLQYTLCRYLQIIFLRFDDKFLFSLLHQRQCKYFYINKQHDNDVYFYCNSTNFRRGKNSGYYTQ